MDHTKSLKRQHRLHNTVVPEFRYIRAARVVSRGRDFNTTKSNFRSIRIGCTKRLFEFVERNGTLIATE